MDSLKLQLQMNVIDVAFTEFLKCFASQKQNPVFH